VPGKQTLTDQLDFQQDPVTAGPQVKVTVNITERMGAPLTFDAANYEELYQQVAARAAQRKEAGSVTCDLSADLKTDASGALTAAVIDAPLVTMLPAWPQKARQPQADQAKFDAWRASVEAHETTHRDIYKREYPKFKTAIVGPDEKAGDAQFKAVSAAAEAAQDAFDASSQPAPLAAPGGIIQVPRRNATDVTTAASADPDPYADL